MPPPLHSPVLKHKDHFVNLSWANIPANGELDFKGPGLLVQLSKDDLLVDGLDDDVFKLTDVVHFQV